MTMRRTAHTALLPDLPSPSVSDPDLLPSESLEELKIRNGHISASLKSMDLPEKRLVALALKTIDPDMLEPRPALSNTGWKVKILAREYARTFNISPTGSFEEMRSASDKLFKKVVIYVVEARDGRMVTKKMRLVSGVSLAMGGGYVELNFAPEAAPHLLRYALLLPPLEP